MLPGLMPLTQEDIDTGALRAPGPVVLDFYQASCPPCRVLEPRLVRIAARFRDAVRVYRVDIERGLAVAERFGVRSLPTVLVLDGGTEVQRLDGLITEAELDEAFGHAAARRPARTAAP